MECRHNRLTFLALTANAVAALTLLCSTPSSAAGGRSATGQEDADSLRNKVSFAYDVNFETHFDNREFDKGGNAFARSMTIFGARLTPTVGIDILERPRAASGPSAATPSTAASGQSATAAAATAASGQSATAAAATAASGQSAAAPSTAASGQSAAAPSTAASGQSAAAPSTAASGQSAAAAATAASGQSAAAPSTAASGQSAAATAAAASGPSATATSAHGTHGTSGRKAGSRESTASHHRIMLGIDIRKDFGADPVSKLVSRHYRDSGTTGTGATHGISGTTGTGATPGISGTTGTGATPGISGTTGTGSTPGISGTTGTGATPGTSATLSPEISDALQEETDRKLSNWNLFGDIVLYYDFSTQVRKCEVGLKAGVFPRRFLGGEYGEYVFSDSLKFCDPNIEGVLVSFRRPNSYYELGCDWMGQQGTIRREKFMIFTAGYADLTRWLKLGYAGYMLHYASSRTAIGVFDNILVNPYVDMNFGAFCGAQRLALNVGWIQTLQRDRRDNSSFSFPCAADIVLEARHWDVGIRNEFVVGTNLQPWYNDRDKAGISYGANLYPGDPFYRIIPDSVAAPLTLTEDGKEVSNPVWGTYDRLDVYYAPNFSEYLKLAVTARFHFAGGRYHGCQQMLSLKFDLESLLAGRCQARRHR